MPRTHVASQKGLLDGAIDQPSFSVGMVDPAHSSQDVPVNLTLQLTRRESHPFWLQNELILHHLGHLQQQLISLWIWISQYLLTHLWIEIPRALIS